MEVSQEICTGITLTAQRVLITSAESGHVSIPTLRQVGSDAISNVNHPKCRPGHSGQARSNPPPRGEGIRSQKPPGATSLWHFDFGTAE